MNSQKNKLPRARRLAGLILSETLLAAAVICVVCDRAVFGRLTWSLIVALSLLLTWAVALPALLVRGKGLWFSLAAFSLAVAPYLYGLSVLLGRPAQMLRIALPMAAVGVGFLWLAALIFSRIRNRWNAGALCLLAAAGLNVIVNAILAALLGEPLFDVWDLLSGGLLLLFAGALFGAGRRQHR